MHNRKQPVLQACKIHTRNKKKYDFVSFTCTVVLGITILCFDLTQHFVSWLVRALSIKYLSRD